MPLAFSGFHKARRRQAPRVPPATPSGDLLPRRLLAALAMGLLFGGASLGALAGYADQGAPAVPAAQLSYGPAVATVILLSMVGLGLGFVLGFGRATRR